MKGRNIKIHLLKGYLQCIVKHSLNATNDPGKQSMSFYHPHFCRRGFPQVTAAGSTRVSSPLRPLRQLLRSFSGASVQL